MTDVKTPVQDRLDKQQAQRLAEGQRVADFQWLMSHPQGRRYVHGLLAKAGIYKKSYTGNSETYFLEGRRSVGLDVMADINTLTPDMFITMLEEQKK